MVANPLAKLQARKFVFTINNFTEEQWATSLTLTEKFPDFYWCVGKEIAPTTGTPHIQGYVNFNGPRKSALWVQKCFNGHKPEDPGYVGYVKPAKGTDQANRIYCNKEGDFICNIPEQEAKAPDESPMERFNREIQEMVMEAYEGVEWNGWQQEILDIIAGKADRRTIHWYWESKGAVGKSFLVKYLQATESIVIADGKSADIMFMVLKELENLRLPRIIILDVPRDSIGWINYSILEKLKNGIISSGKYEGGSRPIPSPHVFIFANEAPNRAKLSADRWHVVEIDEQ